MAYVWCLFGNQPWCLGWLAEKLLFPGLIAILVYRFAVLQLKKKREIDFAEKQLAEFYAPMLGLRAEILNHTMFDRYMRDASYQQDRKRLERNKNRPVDQWLLGESKNYENELERFFAKINERLLGDRIDQYIKMRDTFARKMAYADADTRAWYDYFYAFVEMWRVLRENDAADPGFLPAGVPSELGKTFDEEKLQPFYEHLRDRCDFLQQEIAGKVVVKKPAPVPPPIDSTLKDAEDGSDG